MKYFSMFSGIGGFELGIQRSQPTWECVGFSEIDKHAIKTYTSHFPNHVNYGDATTINAKELTDFDLLVGGFPCQAFSVAGKRRGFEDTRGTLFFDIARICAEKRPRYLVLENVKGLLSHDSGQTFQTILRVLSDIGYECEWQLLNSKNFGVPQNRERIFIIGYLRGEPRPKVFPIGGESKENSDRGQVVGKLQSGYAKGDRTGGYIIEKKKVVSTPIKYLKRNQRFLPTEYSMTVDTVNSNGLLLDGRLRLMTPLECERLQGFPDNWTIGSDTQRYKQCGNAVTVTVIESIFSRFTSE